MANNPVRWFEIYVQDMAVNGWTEDGLLVGHQPFLGQLVSRLVLGEERAVVDYQPGTAVCLEPTGAGDWRIVGMFSPALL